MLSWQLRSNIEVVMTRHCEYRLKRLLLFPLRLVGRLVRPPAQLMSPRSSCHLSSKMHVTNTEIHSSCVAHARPAIHGLASPRFMKIPSDPPDRRFPGRHTCCHASLKWEKEALKHYKDSPVYQEVVREAEMGTLDVKLMQKQYDQKRINTFLLKILIAKKQTPLALDHFGKEARRLKITRDGQISESTFPACDPPKRYPNILVAHCGWPTYEVSRVVQVNNVAMMHIPMYGPEVYSPNKKVLQKELGIDNLLCPTKPRGVYFALGSTEFDWQDLPKWDREVGRLPKDKWKAVTSEEFDLFTLTLSPDAFTWTINPSTQTNKVLIIDCKEQWEAVHQIYRLSSGTDWKKLSEHYAGIDIRIGKYTFGC